MTRNRDQERNILKLKQQAHHGRTIPQHGATVQPELEAQGRGGRCNLEDKKHREDATQLLAKTKTPSDMWLWNWMWGVTGEAANHKAADPPQTGVHIVNRGR